MRGAITAIVQLMLAGAMALPAVAAEPAPAGVKAIQAYGGTWKEDIEYFDTAYSKARHDRSTLHNDCWTTGGYFACRQIVDGDAKVLIVFTCKDEHTCRSYQIPPDGGEPGAGQVLLDGSTWTFPWTAPGDGGKTMYFRVVNVWSSPTTIEFRQEFSADQVHWTRMATGHETKVGKEQ